MTALGTILVLTLTTSKMFMPGMPSMPSIPGMPEGFKMPGMGANKTITATLKSDTKADAKATAQILIPEGLKLGKLINLDIAKPITTKPNKANSDDTETSAKAEKMVIKMYWGSSKTVQKGQPKVIDTGNMLANAQIMNSKNKNKYKAFDFSADMQGSYAYYPGKASKPLIEKAQSPGLYKLVTTYTGGTSFELANNNDFVGAIDLISPKDIDLNNTIKVEWKKTENAVAYLLTAFASQKNVMVSWTSSSTPNAFENMKSQEAISSSEMTKYINDGLLLPAATTTCYIPAGIFKGMDSPMLIITAYGTDKEQDKDGIHTSVIIRSTLSVPLSSMDNEPTDNMEEEY